MFPYAIAAAVSFAVGLMLSPALSAWRERKKPRQTSDLIKKHFAGTAVESLAVTERLFPARVRADLHRALDKAFQSDKVLFSCGIEAQNSYFGIDWPQLASNRGGATAVSISYEEIDIGEEQPVRCSGTSLWLLEKDNVRYAVALTKPFDPSDTPKVRVYAAAANTEQGRAVTQQFFRDLEHAVQRADSYRGKVLSLETNDSYSGETIGITVHKLRTVRRDELILSGTTLDLLERNFVDFLKQRPRLKQLGQSTKKGLLFHGPPGNGKTHTIHYLIGAACGHTTLLISAEQVAKLSEYITLARLLQPSIVILEDVDLIARARSSMSSPCEETMLNKLLNEMDGLREDAEILFILTTNQPSALEEALAARPGRIDQAIEFPPPDALGREKLARLYSQQMQLDSHVLARIVDQTENVSAVFIKELMRRSLQYRLSRSDSTAIEIEDVQSSLEEMLLGASSLNHRVLGFGRNTVVDGRAIDVAADV